MKTFKFRSWFYYLPIMSLAWVFFFTPAEGKESKPPPKIKNKKENRLLPTPSEQEPTLAYVATPPRGWECIQDPSQLPQKVRAIYVGKAQGNSSFTPSINIACESTTLPLKEYVQLAKSYHEGQGDTRCLLLGKIQTGAGTAELVQIDRPTQWGDVRFLQAIFIDQGEAYVVTATCLKNDFNIYSPQFLKAIQSLNIPGKILQIK